MKYQRMEEGIFWERPNRFIAYVEIQGKKETVHVKNTGRCAELLIPGTRVYVQRAEQPERKTQWDLIAVQKGERLVNMDSQIPNRVVEEWIRAGKLFPDATKIRPETKYGNSRFDFYIEAGERKIFLEVKGVTLEQDGVVRFPDAPTERGVKHVEELCQARKDGYEAYIFFVVQMKEALYFAPNERTHPEFSMALRKAKEKGVKILAYTCQVNVDEISIHQEIPVCLGNELLWQLREPLVSWYRMNKRNLPWRENVSAYKVWVSEIMLQQTRVEAVKPYYERFLRRLPTIGDLAVAEEDELLKLWEGLGYYNRVRNMQKAAIQVMEDYQGEFPKSYEKILKLKGIGTYTAGAISSFAFGMAKPAVDGNVLRVLSRFLGSEEDISKARVKKRFEEELEKVIPQEAASDFNQALIELGAIVCVPNGAPKCESCPIEKWCRAKAMGKQMELPVKKKAKERRIEKRTVLILKDGEYIAIRKRPRQGLLAGLYELLNVEGHLTEKEAIEYCKKIGLSPLHIKSLPEAKHIFSHVEWKMTGYVIRVDELEQSCKENFLFVHPEEIQNKYPIPSAFEAYSKYVNLKLGQEKYESESH